MKTLIKETDEYKIYHHTGITRYRGCQCIKDCYCSEDFIPSNYNYYSIVKKFGKHKTTTHTTIEEVNERIELLMLVPNKRYH